MVLQSIQKIIKLKAHICQGEARYKNLSITLQVRTSFGVQKTVAMSLSIKSQEDM